ncbi:UvrB/UvrC motif-containing protein [Dyella sp.]|uniref:UvrB/UvrC motif-containing protein n=1 Tax=Dyella sp. TaxID=1869338 RepID=UPI003F819E6F
MTTIDRTGTVHFHDASLAVWEEGISDARSAGGWEGAQAWELQFKRDVFARIVQTLNRLGWQVTVGTHIFTGNNARYCRKGNLQADLTICGRHIELKFFQDVNAPDRPDHGGRYQLDKERHMPYLLRLEMERTRRRVRDYLCNVFSGYTFKAGEPQRGSGATAMECIAASYASSWHFKGDLSSYKIDPRNRQSADGLTINHGARVWFFDRKGRVASGTAYYNINNMWWVVTGRYDYTNLSNFELFCALPDHPRVKRNTGLRRKRLEKELQRATDAMKFERAAVLRDILFNPGEPLYYVWSERHQLFHSIGFRGYTRNQAHAGKFTADEVSGWHSADNRVIPVQVEREHVAA